MESGRMQWCTGSNGDVGVGVCVWVCGCVGVCVDVCVVEVVMIVGGD